MQSTKKTPRGSKTVLKGTPDGHAKNSAQAKKQKDVIKPEGIKTESESDPAVTKSMTSISQNKSGSHSGKLKKEKTENNLKKKSERSLNNTKSATRSQKNDSKASKAEIEDKNNKRDIALKQNKGKRPLRKRKKVDYSSCGNESGSEADEEWNEKLTSESEESEDLNNTRENSKKKDKTPLVRRRVPSADSGSGTPNEGSGTSFVDLVDDDSDFEVSSKPLVNRRVPGGSSGSKKKDMKIISSDDSDESLKCLGSVCNENGKYLESVIVNHFEKC